MFLTSWRKKKTSVGQMSLEKESPFMLVRLLRLVRAGLLVLSL